MSAAPFVPDASAAALVVVDLQNDFVRAGAPQEVADARGNLPVARDLLDACRVAGIHVIFTRYTAGPDETHLAWFSPECRSEQRSCWPGTMRSYDDGVGPVDGHDIVDEMAPLAGELVVDKFGYGAFHNTVLDDALRARGVRQIWVIGTVTQICVEETVREGFRRGYEVIVAEDAVSSFDDELHRATLRNLAHKFAVVTDTAALHEVLSTT
jgi:nicotinamidase-related amidase